MYQIRYSYYGDTVTLEEEQEVEFYEETSYLCLAKVIRILDGHVYLKLESPMNKKPSSFERTEFPHYYRRGLKDIKHFLIVSRREFEDGAFHALPVVTCISCKKKCQLYNALKICHRGH